MALPTNLPKFNALPKVDPAATNALDNTPDVNLPDATGSVSGSFDFITAFFQHFTEILMPPIVSESEKEDLQEIADNNPEGSPEHETAKKQLEAATMVNAFASPLVRLAILMYVVIIILNILKRIPGVSGVPSMSAILKGLLESGEFNYSDEIDIASGYFKIRKSINYDITYIGSAAFKYENFVGAEVKEVDGQHYPQWGYDGTTPKIPLFPDAMPNRYVEKRWFKITQSTCAYYLKFSGGQLNIGTTDRPELFNLTSIPETCEPLLLDNLGRVAQKAKGRQYEVIVLETNVGSSTIERQIVGARIPKGLADDYTESVGNMKFIKKAQLIDDHIEPTDRLDMSNLVFSNGKLNYGWDLEELTKIVPVNSDPYEQYRNKISTTITWNQSSGSPKLEDDDNGLEFTLNEENPDTHETPTTHGTHRVFRMMFSELKRIEGTGPLNEEDVFYSPKYVEIWGCNYQQKPIPGSPNPPAPLFWIFQIEDRDYNGRILLSSNKSEFNKTGLNRNSIVNLFFDENRTNPNSVPSALHTAYVNFAAASNITDPTAFWNNISNAQNALYPLVNIVGGYSGYTDQFTILSESITKTNTEVYAWLMNRRGTPVMPSDRAKALEYSKLMLKLEKTSNGAGKYCDKHYNPTSDGGDAANLGMEGGYCIDHIGSGKVKYWRWQGEATEAGWNDFTSKLKQLTDIETDTGREYFFANGVQPARNVGLYVVEQTVEVLDLAASFRDADESYHLLGLRHNIYSQVQFNGGPNWQQIGYQIWTASNLEGVLLPDMKDFVISFIDGKATVENNIGIDAIGEKYPPTVVVQDVPELVFEAQDPCTQPQSDMAKKMAMLVENDADQFTVMAAFGCCYTDDLWDKFLELKKAKRHMVRW